MGPSHICGCPFREPRVFEIAHMLTKHGLCFLPTGKIKSRSSYAGYVQSSHNDEQIESYLILSYLILSYYLSI